MIYFLVFFLYFFLEYYRTLKFRVGSDHYIHLRLIYDIGKNGHRFLKKNPSVVGQKYIDYPQLYHWLLSFFKFETIKNKYKSYTIFLNIILLSLDFLFLFFFLELNFLQIFFSFLIFLITPFNFLPWNAKNTGLSARGLGVFMVHIYLYSYLFYYYNAIPYFIISNTIICMLIFITSVMGYQFIVLFSIVFGFVFLTPYPLVSLLAGYLLFLLLFGQFAVDYTSSQIWYKYIYFTYRKKFNALTARYSIYRDFMWDFFKIFITNPKKFLEYFLFNPIISILVFIPQIIFCIVLFANNGFSINDPLLLFLVKICMVVGIIFIITSFRLTRFLGEPERYIEFIIPILSIIATMLSTNKYIYIIISIESLIALLLILFTVYKLPIYKNMKQWESECEELKGLVSATIDTTRNTILSNSMAFSSFLLQYPNFKVFFPSLNYPYTGKFKFDEIFKGNYGSINDIDLLMEICREFEIDYCVFYQMNNINDLVEINRSENFKIYKVKASI